MSVTSTAVPEHGTISSVLVFLRTSTELFVHGAVPDSTVLGKAAMLSRMVGITRTNDR